MNEYTFMIFFAIVIIVGVIKTLDILRTEDKLSWQYIGVCLAGSCGFLFFAYMAIFAEYGVINFLK